METVRCDDDLHVVQPSCARWPAIRLDKKAETLWERFKKSTFKQSEKEGRLDKKAEKLAKETRKALFEQSEKEGRLWKPTR